MENVKLTGQRSINIKPELWAKIVNVKESTYVYNATRWEEARVRVRQHKKNKKDFLIELEYESISQWQGESSETFRYAVYHKDIVQPIEAAINDAISALQSISSDWEPIEIISELYQSALDALPPVEVI